MFQFLALRPWVPLVLLLHVAPGSSAPTGGAAQPDPDVLVYGSTPGAIMAAVAASRAGASVTLVDPARRIGGCCAGGLGRTDRGNSIVIGGLANEFFQRNRRFYAPGSNDSLSKPVCAGDNTAVDCGIYLEPHVAEAVFQDMLTHAGVKQVKVPTRGGSGGGTPAQSQQVGSVVKGGGEDIRAIIMEDGTTTFSAKVFIDGTYEGDLMARSGADFTWGRESRNEFNESYGGRGEPYSRMDWAPVSPYAADGTLHGPLVTLPLSAQHPYVSAPLGTGDDKVQAYNFRLCVTREPTNRVPFPKPRSYNRSDWDLLFKYAARGQSQGAVLASYLNNIGPVPGGKFDMNNGGLISTDCAGCSWGYPNSTYEERRVIYQRHVDYQQGFLWTLANDEAIPAPVRSALNEYGLCKDEFQTNGHWPEQLYIREARRMRGDTIFTQNDVLAMRKYSETNESAGMGSYNFDAHYSHRGPCIPNSQVAPSPSPSPSSTPRQEQGCRMLTAADPPLTLEQKLNDSLVWTGGEGYGGPLHATYELPFSLLLPKRSQVTNMLCPLTPSVTHIALATVRMEPQFMILGQTAGTAAALAAKSGVAVHDVNRAALAQALLDAGQILSSTQFPASGGGGKPGGEYTCGLDRCYQPDELQPHAPHVYRNSTCAGKCGPLLAAEWLALRTAFQLDAAKTTLTTVVDQSFLKKSELHSSILPALEKQKVTRGEVLHLSAPAKEMDQRYWLVVLT